MFPGRRLLTATGGTAVVTLASASFAQNDTRSPASAPVVVLATFIALGSGAWRAACELVRRRRAA